MQHTLVSEVFDENGFKGRAEVKLLVEELHAVFAVTEQLYHLIAVIVQRLHALPHLATPERVAPLLPPQDSTRQLLVELGNLDSYPRAGVLNGPDDLEGYVIIAEPLLYPPIALMR